MRVQGLEIDTILCDVGGVVITFDHAVAAHIEMQHHLEPGLLLHTALKSPVAKRAMVGAVDVGEWFRRTSAVVGEAALNQWLDYHGERDEAVVSLLGAIRQDGIRVVLLSNATTRLWDDLAFHDLDGLADQVLCSADIGLAKPDHACFRYAAEHGDFALTHTLYVDDTASWVAEGMSLGLRGHVFTSAEALTGELASLARVA